MSSEGLFHEKWLGFNAKRNGVALVVTGSKYIYFSSTTFQREILNFLLLIISVTDSSTQQSFYCENQKEKQKSPHTWTSALVISEFGLTSIHGATVYQGTRKSNVFILWRFTSSSSLSSLVAESAVRYSSVVVVLPSGGCSPRSPQLGL